MVEVIRAMVMVMVIGVRCRSRRSCRRLIVLMYANVIAFFFARMLVHPYTVDALVSIWVQRMAPLNCLQLTLPSPKNNHINHTINIRGLSSSYYRYRSITCDKTALRYDRVMLNSL